MALDAVDGCLLLGPRRFGFQLRDVERAILQCRVVLEAHLQAPSRLPRLLDDLAAEFPAQPADLAPVASHLVQVGASRHRHVDVEAAPVAPSRCEDRSAADPPFVRTRVRQPLAQPPLRLRPQRCGGLREPERFPGHGLAHWLMASIRSGQSKSARCSAADQSPDRVRALRPSHDDVGDARLAPPRPHDLALPLGRRRRPDRVVQLPARRLHVPSGAHAEQDVPDDPRVRPHVLGSDPGVDALRLLVGREPVVESFGGLELQVRRRIAPPLAARLLSVVHYDCRRLSRRSPGRPPADSRPRSPRAPPRR